MPKMKSHSGAKKRFKVTGSGKIKRKSAGLNHILAKQKQKIKRQLGKDQFVSQADKSRVERLLNI